jgi:hypothetical protein
MGEPDGELFIVRFNAMEQWRAIIDHTQFPSAIYDSSGKKIGHYDGADNLNKTEWKALDNFANEAMKPFLEVDESPSLQATYLKLDNIDLMNLSEESEDWDLNDYELAELYAPPGSMLDYFGYTRSEMLPNKGPNELRPNQLYAGMTEMMTNSDIMGGGEQMLPTLLPGTHLPQPKVPDLNYFKRLNQTMTEDLMKKAEPWARTEQDSVDMYINEMMNRTGMRPGNNLDAFHTYMRDFGQAPQKQSMH